MQRIGFINQIGRKNKTKPALENVPMLIGMAIITTFL
jgi:hypothetical protein